MVGKIIRRFRSPMTHSRLGDDGSGGGSLDKKSDYSFIRNVAAFIGKINTVRVQSEYTIHVYDHCVPRVTFDPVSDFQRNPLFTGYFRYYNFVVRSSIIRRYNIMNNAVYNVFIAS